jgi:hypothetical protein
MRLGFRKPLCSLHPREFFLKPWQQKGSLVNFGTSFSKICLHAKRSQTQIKSAFAMVGVRVARWFNFEPKIPIWVNF